MGQLDRSTRIATQRTRSLPSSDLRVFVPSWLILDFVASPKSAPMPDDQLDLTGRELGDYRVLRRLGAGGMAQVYLAEQQSLSRSVALKILQPALARDASYVARFLQEARAAAALVHAN